MRWPNTAKSTWRFFSRGCRVRRLKRSTILSRRRALHKASTEGIHDLAKKAAAENDCRLKARLAVVRIHLEDDRIAADVCRIDDRPDPVQRTIFIDELPAWHGDVTKLATYCQGRSDAALRSGLCLAVGGIPAGQLTEAERNAWKPVLTQWYETALDGGTHSAAGWALRQWGVEVPAVSATSQPSQGRQWLVNSLDMTLLKINPGELRSQGSNA